jgi:acyl dehydratase
MSTLTFDSAAEGDTLPSLTLPAVTRHQLALYCGGSGDHNPIHVDSDFAKQAGMKDVFAHGMLSMAFMGRLVTGLVPQSSVKSLSVRFSAITWVGDVITVSARVAKKDFDNKSLVLDLTCVNQNGEVTSQGQAIIG